MARQLPLKAEVVEQLLGALDRHDKHRFRQLAATYNLRGALDAHGVEDEVLAAQVRTHAPWSMEPLGPIDAVSKLLGRGEWPPPKHGFVTRARAMLVRLEHAMRGAVSDAAAWPTAAEAARQWEVRPPYVSRVCAEGRVRCVKLGASVRIHPGDLEREMRHTKQVRAVRAEKAENEELGRLADD